jgi:hypothetical protein
VPKVLTATFVAIIRSGSGGPLMNQGRVNQMWSIDQVWSTILGSSFEQCRPT